ncbi:hypothetical protein [Enterococcus pallens]|uniref:Uncharacterized protein n=1 Tax=Enterococcus pallens ATCC BAA-351 TaxID=1158607 RepID=R2Q6N7_9ENTE|nr:hypothetical protein [Enterococcus pallens]EOH90908.1 hypothetical protein UAU_03447 [Enterococcus pallens ATCC BAA-351]EOU16104.1 hypothetical protein I588_03760 [Enterococcus pallens ATCC BAA-351]OJG77421.1 hypothetical protein RV10_GL002531 [Enterococcus pallens]
MLKRYQQIIDDMYRQQETESNEEKLANTRLRNLRMAAIISDYLKQLAGTELIVTGGLSVDFYT